MTSLEQNFQNLRKVSSQIFAMIMWSRFHKNRPKIVAIRDPDRQTDRQSHAQTGLVHGPRLLIPGLTLSGRGRSGPGP